MYQTPYEKENLSNGEETQPLQSPKPFLLEGLSLYREVKRPTGTFTFSPGIMDLELKPNLQISIPTKESWFGLKTKLTPKIDKTIFGLRQQTYEVTVNYADDKRVGFPLEESLYTRLKAFFPQLNEVFVNGCCGATTVHYNGNLLSDEFPAHTHKCPKDPNKGAICFHNEDHIFLEDGFPSDISFHEYAHILDDTWPYANIPIEYITCLPDNRIRVVGYRVAEVDEWEAHGEVFNRILADQLGRPDISGPYVFHQRYAQAAALIVRS